MTLERKLAAILSADATDYSRLMADDAVATVNRLKESRDLIGGLVLQHAGRVVDAVGDNLLADFRSAIDAVACAVAVQERLSVRNGDASPETSMQFRIGVSLGDVIADGEEIYGDGVNIAARVEALAAPGAVAISGSVFDHVEGRLGLEFEDLGEHAVKNVERPVRVYRALASRSSCEIGRTSVPGFSGRPAIAVLPFDNLSSPEDECIVDGFVDELISRLSRTRQLPVIARNSSFVYKGGAIDLKRVGRELGVRYAVSGSLRRAGPRVRVVANLMEVPAGRQLWTEVFDREIADVFALQDEISQLVVAQVAPEVSRAEQRRSRLVRSANLQAWELTQHGAWHLGQMTAESLVKARELYVQAVSIDGSCAEAYAGLAEAHRCEATLGFSADPKRSLAAAIDAAEKAVAADARVALGHAMVGAACSVAGEFDRSLAELERALELDPSLTLAYAHLAKALSSVGRPDEAIAQAEKALRLSPNDSLAHVFAYAIAYSHFSAGRYADAAAAARDCLHRSPGYALALGVLCASHAHLGEFEDARRVREEIERRMPGWTVSRLREYLSSQALTSDFLERLLAGLRMAGLSH